MVKNKQTSWLVYRQQVTARKKRNLGEKKKKMERAYTTISNPPNDQNTTEYRNLHSKKPRTRIVKEGVTHHRDNTTREKPRVTDLVFGNVQCGKERRKSRKGGRAVKKTQTKVVQKECRNAGTEGVLKREEGSPLKKKRRF